MRYLPIALVALMLSCSQSPEPTPPSTNRAPVIDSVLMYGIAVVGIPVDVVCYAHDPDGDRLSYFWRVADGNIVGNGQRVQFLPSPCCNGSKTTMQVIVRDPYGASDSREISIFVWQ